MKFKNGEDERLVINIGRLRKFYDDYLLDCKLVK